MNGLLEAAVGRHRRALGHRGGRGRARTREHPGLRGTGRAQATADPRRDAGPPHRPGPTPSRSAAIADNLVSNALKFSPPGSHRAGGGVAPRPEHRAERARRRTGLPERSPRGGPALRRPDGGALHRVRAEAGASGCTPCTSWPPISAAWWHSATTRPAERWSRSGSRRTEQLRGEARQAEGPRSRRPRRHGARPLPV